MFLRKRLAPMAAGILAGLATAFVAATPASAQAQEISADEAVAYTAWHAASQAQSIPEAMAAADAYLKQFPSGQYAEFLGKWLPQARLSGLDAAIKAKDMPAMIAMGRQVLAHEPENLNVLYALAQNLRLRELMASPQKLDNAKDAKEFALAAVSLVESGKTLAGAESFDKDATLAWLYQTLAVIEDKAGDPKGAIKLYERSSALAPGDVAIRGRNLLNVIAIRQNAYADTVKAYNALPEAERAAAEPSAAVKSSQEAVNREADALIEATASFVAFGRARKLPAATVERLNQVLETVYKGRYPADTNLDGLNKILAEKGGAGA